MKDAMESKRREMCQVIKEDLIARVSKEVEEKERESFKITPQSKS